MTEGIVILIFFLLMISGPAIGVGIVLFCLRQNRESKRKAYGGRTVGRVVRIKYRGAHQPPVLFVSYEVDGNQYEISETVKFRSQAIRFYGIPIGQRKTWQLGPLQEGDPVTVHYLCQNPGFAMIAGNDSFLTG